jgi:hypothetical protein
MGGKKERKPGGREIGVVHGKKVVGGGWYVHMYVWGAMLQDT